MKRVKNSQGFSLVEIMISLVLGLIISGTVIQVFVSNNLTERLNRAVASAQENGRFIVSRMRSEILEAGRYDQLQPSLDRSVDVVEESAFVQNHPIPLPGDFDNDAGLGAIQGPNGESDELVIGLQAERDCRGYKLGYDDGVEFYVVNHYYLEGTALKCKGYDGRYLRGQKIAEGHNNHAGFTLLDDVIDFQVLYGITNHLVTGNSSGQPIQYITADDLAAEIASGSHVVAVRISLLVMGDGEVVIEPTPSFKLLNEVAITPSQKRFFKVFETTITLRNSKNFIRSRRV